MRCERLDLDELIGKLARAIPMAGTCFQQEGLFENDLVARDPLPSALV